MNMLFYISAAVAVVATLLVITRSNAVHALLYMILSLLAVALVFFSLGAEFAAALEVIIYAGAILILFIFVIMMLNLGVATAGAERWLLRPRTWIGPGLLAAALLAALVFAAPGAGAAVAGGQEITVRQVGAAMFGRYLLGVELASVLLLAALVGAYHLGRDDRADAKGDQS